MKHLLFVFILILPFQTFSQLQLKKSSLAPGWFKYHGNNLHILSTVGEMAIQERDAVNLHLSEGFLTPELVASLNVSNYAQMTGFDIYPLPVANVLNIKTAQEGQYEIYLYDVKGQEVLLKKFKNANYFKIPVKFLAKGTYVLVIVNRSKEKFSVKKIIKN